MRTNEIKNKLDKIKKWEDKIKRKDLKYETNKYIYIYNFQQFETVRSFDDNIYTDKISIDEAEIDQSSILENMAEFNNKTRPIKRR